MKEKKKTKGKEKKKKSAFKKIQDKQKPSENWDFFLKTIVRKKIIEYVWLEGKKMWLGEMTDAPTKFKKQKRNIILASNSFKNSLLKITEKQTFYE